MKRTWIWSDLEAGGVDISLTNVGGSRASFGIVTEESGVESSVGAGVVVERVLGKTAAKEPVGSVSQYNRETSVRDV